MRARPVRRRIAAMVLVGLVAGAAMFAASATFAADDADAALDMFLDLGPVKGESADDE